MRELADLLTLGQKTIHNHLHGRSDRSLPGLVETGEVKIVGKTKHKAYLYGLHEETE